jgi:divalent metal cation (Fe/Co/Zn/Cd) transporter
VLKTAGLHWFIDSALSLSMCLGFLAGLFLRNHGYTKITPYVDPVMAIILALVLMKLPVRSITHNLFELLDAAPAREIQDRIREIAGRHKSKFLDIHRIRFRKAGRKLFLDICFLARGDFAVKEAQSLSDSFEQQLKKEFPNSDVVTYFKMA